MRFRKVGILTQDSLVGPGGCGKIFLLAQQHAQDEIGLGRLGTVANVSL